MKKILLFASVVAAMASCAKTEVSDINTDSPSVISFTTGVSSKASDTVIGTFTDDEATANLKLYANDVDGNFGSKINSTLAYDKTEKTWSSDKTYYWTSGVNANFYAYYPSTLELTDTTLPVTIGATAAAQTDIVVASYTGGQSNGDVVLTLQHILSRVNFNIKVDDEVSMDLNSLTLKGINTTTGGYELVTGKMGDTSAAGTYTYGTALTQNITDKTVDPSSTDGKFMLLPQELTALAVAADMSSATGACIVLEYKLTYLGTSDTPDTMVAGSSSAYVTAYIPIPTITWEAGKSYVYTLDVTKSWNGGYDGTTGNVIIENPEIGFSVSVGDWATDANGDDTETDVDVTTPSVD